MQREYDLAYDKIVVGSSLAALKYAHSNQIPIILYEPKPPHRFSEGYVKGEYQNLCFALSVAGLVPFSNKIERIRYQQGDSLKVTIKNSFLFRLSFNKLIFFCDDGVEGLPVPVSQTEERYEVLDWFSVRSGMNHEHDRIESTSDFVKCIHFYPTERLDGHHPNKKDAVAISYMTADQLKELSWSEGYARLKVLDMMKQAGIKGQSCGSTNYALKIESSAREVYSLSERRYEFEDERVEFIND